MLKAADISFGLLEEPLDGSDILSLGETELFAACCQKAVEFYQKMDVKRICTFSPHSYHVFKNYFPQYGGRFQVTHYTQLLANLVEVRKLKFSQSAEYKVAYHDPCYLGRWNQDYESARFFIRAKRYVFSGISFFQRGRFFVVEEAEGIFTPIV